MRATDARDANAGWGREAAVRGRMPRKPHLHQNKHVIESKEADQTADQQTAAQRARLTTMHTDYPDGSLPAHRRGTLRGMDAA
ncbi:hypothetical protein FHR65_002370 [Xanthomonas arboricola]|uniref:Uncharacterized protein n=1 Tax=Xanthomonas arboricola TaxID=56448 RepID=A0AB73GXF2_9XANT|nr:hypothetical protein [Xanthomonas arboricola]